ncbi:MAG: sigma-54 dependent transcriptional regulator [Polyangiaceae bacterium]
MVELHGGSIHGLNLLDETTECARRLLRGCDCPEALARHLQKAQQTAARPRTRPIRSAQRISWRKRGENLGGRRRGRGSASSWWRRSSSPDTRSRQPKPAEQALGQAKRQLTFHVVISDLRLPGKSGIDLLRQLRQDAPDTQVVMLTAHASVESAVDAMRLGAFDYLEKPIGSPAELRLVVDRALEKRGLLAAKEQALRTQDSVDALSYGAETMQPVVAAAERVARTDATVLLLGESGTGKEVLARAIHQQSNRRDAPFVAINCAALSSHLLESELFGHEKGAFTGAHARRQGRIELAEGGTFFLDEIGKTRAGCDKLLRVLQDRRFERVGGSRTLAADVRWVAATNRDLRPGDGRGNFREFVSSARSVPHPLAPLRERREDIVPSRTP